jgi:hypothetical protein
MAKKTFEPSTAQNASQDSIARRAYEIWQSEGCPDGRAMEHWLRAVSELKTQQTQSNGTRHETETNQSEMGKPRISRRPAPRPAEKRFQTTQ